VNVLYKKKEMRFLREAKFLEKVLCDKVLRKIFHPKNKFSAGKDLICQFFQESSLREKISWAGKSKDSDKKFLA
jgi:hypothetical protein